jgi:quercetin dioxygenase-like cupin family protein
MQVFSAGDTETRRGPEEWFTGTVWMEAASVPPPGAGLFRVLFEPGARTNWHAHPEGQILHVLTGTGRVQKSGEQAIEIGPGDTVYIAPGEKHWHGAAPDAFMVHVAINPALSTDGGTDWMEPVTDEDYSGG